jgi:hypothetical protein
VDDDEDSDPGSDPATSDEIEVPVSFGVLKVTTNPGATCPP